jgi:hypothetical protein
MIEIKLSYQEITFDRTKKRSRTIPNFSLKERQRKLVKFEMLMLGEESALEVYTAFSERNISYEEPLFKAWIVLKNASLPTEAQVLQKKLLINFITKSGNSK